MTWGGVFAALTLADQCGGPDLPPCPEAMIIWEGQEAYLNVSRVAYLAYCKGRWERERYYPAVGYAVLFCTHNELPLPAWTVNVVNQAMLTAFEHGGRTNNRRAGGYRPQARRLEVHKERWAMVRQYKQLGGVTEDDAFERASEQLRGTSARGEPRQVEESYRKIQRQRASGAV